MEDDNPSTRHQVTPGSGGSQKTKGRECCTRSRQSGQGGAPNECEEAPLSGRQEEIVGILLFFSGLIVPLTDVEVKCTPEVRHNAKKKCL